MDRNSDEMCRGGGTRDRPAAQLAAARLHALELRQGAPAPPPHRPRSRPPPSPSPHHRIVVTSSPVQGDQQDPGIGADAADKGSRRKRNRLPEEKRIALPFRYSYNQISGSTSPSGRTATTCIDAPAGAIRIQAVERHRALELRLARHGNSALGHGKGGRLLELRTGGSDLALLPVMPPSTQSATGRSAPASAPCRSEVPNPSRRPREACAAPARCPSWPTRYGWASWKIIRENDDPLAMTRRAPLVHNPRNLPVHVIRRAVGVVRAHVHGSASRTAARERGVSWR